MTSPHEKQKRINAYCEEEEYHMAIKNENNTSKRKTGNTGGGTTTDFQKNVLSGLASCKTTSYENLLHAHSYLNRFAPTPVRHEFKLCLNSP